MPHGFSHLALATRDLAATHRFYTEVMGFRLAKVEAAPTPTGRGWARHVFYDCGDGELMAFWDLHDEEIGDDFPTAISTGVGLPEWVNHVAWSSPDEQAFQAQIRRWLDHGITVAEIDHGWCRSIYTRDPNGILVECCLMVRELDATDQAEAEALLAAEQPQLDATPPAMRLHRPAARTPA